MTEYVVEQELEDLFFAVAQGDLMTVMRLRAAGVNLNSVDSQGQSLLHVVSDVVIASYLIKHGAALNTQDLWGDTPLHSAVRRNNLVLAKRLLEENILQIDCKNELGNTALHVAAHQNFELIHSNLNYSLLAKDKKKRADNLVIMKALLQKGANPDAANHFGYTPLHLAVSCCHNCFGRRKTVNNPDYRHVKNKVLLLCQSGANPSCQTNSTKLIKTKAIYSNNSFNIYDNTRALDILYQHPVDQFDRVKQTNMKKEIATILVKCGADPTVFDNEGLSMLHACAKIGDAEGLAFFIELGLAPDFQPTPYAVSPLHQLFYWQSSKQSWEQSGKQCAELLLYHGANPNIKMKCKFPHLKTTTFLLPEEYGKLNPFVIICDEAIEYLRSARITIALQSSIPADSLQGFAQSCG